MEITREEKELSAATIGAHLELALDFQTEAASWFQLAEDEDQEILAYQALGKAYGHAFRAAEIAHDIGFSHPSKNKP